MQAQMTAKPKNLVYFDKWMDPVAAGILEAEQGIVYAF